MDERGPTLEEYLANAPAQLIPERKPFLDAPLRSAIPHRAEGRDCDPEEDD